MKKFLPVLILTSVLVAPMLASAVVAPGEEVPAGICEGRTMGHKIKGCEACAIGNVCTVEACCLLDIIYTVVDWIFVVLLVIAGIFILWGGIEFITSGGDPEKVGAARNKLIWALVGVVVAFISKGLVVLITQIIKK